MGYLLTLLGLHQVYLFTRRPTARPLLLGAGLVMLGGLYLSEPGTWLHRALSWSSWPVLAAALVACYRDGTLAETYLCRRKKAAGAAPHRAGE